MVLVARNGCNRRIAFDQVSNGLPIGAKPELLLNAGSTSAELYKTDLPQYDGAINANEQRRGLPARLQPGREALV